MGRVNRYRAFADGKWWYSDDEAYCLKEVDGKLMLMEIDNFYSSVTPLELSVIGEAFQFTGLLDRDGVEIYEGCILQTPFEYHGNVHTGEGELNGMYRGLVHYTPSQGFIQRRCLIKDEESDKWEKRRELSIRSTYTRIIGSIQENPELLEQS